MTVTEDSELHESNRQFIDMGMRFAVTTGAEVVEMRGLTAAWGNSPVPFCNGIFLSQPVTDLADLQSRSAALAEYLKSKEKPPLFLACREWLPEPLRDAADALLRDRRIF